MRLDKQKSKDL